MIKMPSEYKGKYAKKDKYKINCSRMWTNEEIAWCLDLRDKGYTVREIAESVDREYNSVSIKMKRLQKKNDNYNKRHIIEKYDVNKKFCDFIQPTSILDVYCGEKSFYKANGYPATTNDINIGIDADLHLDSLKLLCMCHMNGNKYDLIDLDPFGSAFNCFELAIQLANKGLVITLGELGHKRFKRLDFVRRIYGIETLDDFTTDNMIKVIQQIARKYKKELVVYEIKEWQGISRVWFTVHTLIIKEQWDNMKQ